MTSNVPKAASAQPGISAGSIMQVFALALVIAALSEWLGPLPIELGIGKVVLLPMIWALLIGLILGLLAKRMPKPVSLGLHSQHLAAAVLSCALFLFIAKLGLMVGGSLPQLAQGGLGPGAAGAGQPDWLRAAGYASGAAAGHQARSHWCNVLDWP